MSRILLILAVMAFPAVVFARDLNIITYNAVVAPPAWEFTTSSPRDNELLNGPPNTFIINFSLNVDPNKSGFTLYDPYNNPLPLKVENKDTTISAPLPATLPTGMYRVDWHADCLCKVSMPLQGTLHFTIQ
jgi:methionine-rich copper-binding protein CopC